MAGTVFRCGDLELFAPAEAATRGHRGDARRLYRVAGPAEWVGADQRYEQVLDMLPDSLTISWRRQNNSPVSLTVSGYDGAAGTAAFTLTGERNPRSRLFTPLKIEGTCQTEPSAGAERQERTP